MTPMNVCLSIGLAGSRLMADFDNMQVREWGPILDSADCIGLVQKGEERLRVELNGSRRWIAFKRALCGSQLYCIGYQETVGGVHRAGMISGGSNRKTLAWLHPSGKVHIGDEPGG